MTIERVVPELRRQTAAPAAGASAELAEQARALHARAAIDDLVTLYSVAVDDHDLDTVVDCFAPDATFVRRSRVVTGHAELRDFYRASMERYGLTVHTPHRSVITVTGETATGLVLGHAELAYREGLYVAAFRYADAYRVHDGRWVFARRELSFAYVVPATGWDQAATTSLRIRWPDVTAEPGDYPETFPTWRSYR